MWRVFVLACWVCAEEQPQRPRVYLGQADTKNQFPFVVSIQDTHGYRQCTCSLIARNWILTAGHCVDFDMPMFIRYRNMTLDPAKAVKAKAYRRILKFFLHPRFLNTEIDDRTLQNDLALALIQHVPRQKKIGKLSAIDYKALLGYPVQYAGFGYTGEKDFSEDLDQFKPLQTGNGIVISCESEYPDFSPSICVAPKCSNEFQDTRPGDSGSPLVYGGKIVGVLMGGSDTPPISQFTAVSPNLAWIADVMKRFN